MKFPQLLRCSTALLLIMWSSRTHQNPLPATQLIPPTTPEIQERYGVALEAIFGIGVRLQALLEDPSMPNTNNFLVSPLSVALIIGQLLLGAEGKFRAELYNLLSLPESADQNYVVQYKNTSLSLPFANLHLQMGDLAKALQGKQISKNFTLNSSNALFVNTRLKLREAFLKHLSIYDTQVHPLNFTTEPLESQKFVNDWVEVQTNGAIKMVLPAPLPPTAAAIFANALYFLADWETPFSYQANTRGAFHQAQDRTVEVEYMRGFMEDIPYAESSKLGCKMVALPYKNNEVAMYFMLPNADNGTEYDIRKFAEKLNAKDVLEAISALKKHSVTLQIPKMKLSSSLSLLKPLQKYRLFERQQNKTENETGDSLDVLKERLDKFDKFSPDKEVEIYLTGAAEKEKLKVTNILQEVTLNVDEKGTEAAAVSLSIIDYIGGSKMFRLDRPFVFFIRHEVTTATLFWGTIVDPGQSD